MARTIDPDRWRDAIRSQLGANDPEALRRLASDEKALASQPARGLLLLAQVVEDYEHGVDDSIQGVDVEDLLMRAWRLSPNDFWICSELGKRNRVRFSTAAISLRPESPGAHHNLGEMLAPSSFNRLAMDWTRDEFLETAFNPPPLAPRTLDEAIAEHRVAVRLGPGEAIFHFYLAMALLQKEGMWDEALAELREAQLLPSRNASPWLTERLATVLFNLRKREHAIVLLADLQRLHPVGSRTNLPMFLDRFGRYLLEIAEFDEGLAKIREALRLQPDEPAYLCSLGEGHFARGELKEALAKMGEVNRKVDQPAGYIGDALRRVRRLAALELRIGAILNGGDLPDDAEGKLDAAELCRVTRRFVSAARFYRGAFRLNPAFADDLNSLHRLHAAIAAARAGTDQNQAKDEPPLDEPERARWRLRPWTGSAPRRTHVRRSSNGPLRSSSCRAKHGSHPSARLSTS